MTLGPAEGGIDERPHVFLGRLRADHARAKGHHVAAVVLDHLMGAVNVVGDARAHAGELVGGDRDAGAAAADQDRALHASRGERVADQPGEGRVVVVGAVELGAEHDRLVAGVPDHLGDLVPDRRPRVVGGNELMDMQRLVRRVPAAGFVIRYAMRLARLTRPGSQDGEPPDPNVPDFVKKYVTWGAGPRAGQNLILAAKARALLKGRTYVATEDVKAVAMPVLRHRVVTNYNADADRVTQDEIVRKLLALVPARAAE